MRVDSTPRKLFLPALVVLCAASAFACSDPSSPAGDAGLDGSPVDASIESDSGPEDAGGSDADETPGDAGSDGGTDAGSCMADERCDGADDDCDGRVDEDVTDCGAGQRCEAAACAAPSWTWETTFGASGVLAQDVDADADGNLYVVGWADSSSTIGAAAISPGAFLASFDTSGALRWVRGFGGAGYAFSVAVAGDRVYVLTETRFGSSGATIDFGGGPRTGTESACHVAAFDRGGAYELDRAVTSGWSVACRSLAARSGRLVVSRSDAGMDSQVLVLDGATLAELWRRSLAVDVIAEFTAADVASDGAVIAGGLYDSSIDPGLGALGEPMSRGAFVVAYDAAGTPRWQRALDTALSEYVQSIAWASGGRSVVLLAGAGTDPAISEVVGLDDDGTERFRRPLGRLFASDLALAPDERVGVVVESIGAVDLGGGLRAASSGYLVTLDAAGAYRWDVAAGRSALGVVFAADRWAVTGRSVGGDQPGWLATLAD